MVEPQTQVGSQLSWAQLGSNAHIDEAYGRGFSIQRYYEALYKIRFTDMGPDPNSNGFFWLAGQGGFGVQTSPALGQLTAGSILNNEPIDQTIHRQRFG